MVFLDNFVYNLFLSDLHHLYRSEYTYGIKLLFLTGFVFICDSTFQCLVMQGLYNVNCVNYVYHVSSTINSIPFKFGVRKKMAFHTAHALIVQFLCCSYLSAFCWVKHDCIFNTLPPKIAFYCVTIQSLPP